MVKIILKTRFSPFNTVSMSIKYRKIVYISSVTSRERFDLECCQHLRTEGYQNQKFHHLLLKGLLSVFDGSIDVVSKAIPSKSLFVKKVVENEDGITYYHPSFVRIPILGQLLEYFCCRLIIKRIIQDDSIIICNVLDEFLSFAALDVAKRKGAIICGIVTDVPGYTSGAAGKTKGLKGFFLKKLLNRTIASTKQYNAYLLLAEAMNEIVNPHHMPHIVIEGFSDYKMKDVPNFLNKKTVPKIMMYAGGIHKEYGINTLVEAFLSIDSSDWQLVIYGMGNYRDELFNICKEHHNIIFRGLVSNEIIIQEQLKATLLVNPRPTKEVFVKYSFPSKTLECMASGTPLVTTCIPSMPIEYKPYVYFFEEESTDGFVKTLSYLMSLPSEVLHEKGILAKEFILNNRNNIKQAEKLLQFLSNQ